MFVCYICLLNVVQVTLHSCFAFKFYYFSGKLVVECLAGYLYFALPYLFYLPKVGKGIMQVKYNVEHILFGVNMMISAYI